MSTVRAAFNISSTIVKSVVKVAGFGFVADAIEGGQELYQLACSLKDETFGSAEAQMSGTLRNSISDELASIEHQLGSLGRDEKSIDLFIGRLETSAKQTITQLLNDENALGEAITEPAKFHTYVLTQSAPERATYAPEEVHHLDSLLHRIADEYLTLARKSPNYNETALRATVEQLSEIRAAMKELQNLVANTSETHSKEHQEIYNQIKQLQTTVEDGLSNRRSHQPNNSTWGSRPQPLRHWIERNPAANGRTIQDVIFSSDKTDEPSLNVLIGCAGVGKTSLAAKIADRCIKDNWPLVIWISATSKQSIRDAFINIGETIFNIQTDQAQNTTNRTVPVTAALSNLNIGPCLFVFDGAKSIDDITECLPHMRETHFLVTTRSDIGWDTQQGWNLYHMKTFTRIQSIEYLCSVTNENDLDTANAIAQQLGDLPLAVAQAANTAKMLRTSLPPEGNCLKMFHQGLLDHSLTDLLPSLEGTQYPYGAIQTLRMFAHETLAQISDDKQRCDNMIAILSYLSAPYVPTEWLATPGDILATLAHSQLAKRSLIETTGNKELTSLNTLQAYAIRSAWSPKDIDQAAKLSLDLLLNNSNSILSHANITKRPEKLLSLAQQLSFYALQEHTEGLLSFPEVQTLLLHCLETMNELRCFQCFDYLLTAYGTISQIIGKPTKTLLQCINQIGLALMHTGQHELSERVLLNSFNQHLQLPESHEDPRILITILNSLGEAYSRNHSQLPNARNMFHQAYILAEHSLQIQDDLRSECQSNLARIHSELGENRTSNGIIFELLDTMEAFDLYEHKLFRRSLLLYAFNVAMLGDKEQAYDLFDDLIQASFTKGAHSPEYLHTLETVAKCSLILEDYQSSKKHWLTLIQAQESIYTIDHTDIFISYTLLSQCLLHLHEYEVLTHTFLKRYFECFETLGPDHEVTTATQEQIANFATEMGFERFVEYTHTYK